MYVIGTAGHVDHGKSTLVQALTGIDPDRLAEEKAREMTIDLGFAWLTLGDDTAVEEVGVVDVPGHRDFIENMLAGVGGIDVALFVVAADEGVMPQTREHLAILDLLEVRDGVVALTKVDMIDDDPDWLELVTLDVQEVLQGTILEDAPIMPVSAKSGAGLDELRAILWQRLSASPPRPDNGRPRLPIDRIFTLSGFGTVVTGTLTDGRLHIGDAIELVPTGHKGRIRGLQTHKTKLETALPGSRVAVNISGIDRDQVKRGDVMTGAEQMRSTILFDGSYRHLAEADAPLTHNMEVKLFVGASEMVSRVRVLGKEQIEAGESGWIQIATKEAVAVLRGDRFILRRPSPGATLGGGTVLDPFPGRKHRRFRPDTVERLKTLSQGTPDELVLQALQRIEPATETQLVEAAGLDKAETLTILVDLLASEQVAALDKQLMSRQGWLSLADRLARLVAEHHKAYPLRLGMPREECRSRLQLKTAVFNPLVNRCAQEGMLVEENTLLRLPNHAIQFTAAQQQLIDTLLNEFAKAGVNSPSVKQSKTAVGDDVYFALVDLDILQPISSDVVYTTEFFTNLLAKMKTFLQENGRVNAAQTRDLFDTSRKYAIAILEYLDETKITRRVGDDRELL